MLITKVISLCSADPVPQLYILIIMKIFCALKCSVRNNTDLIKGTLRHKIMLKSFKLNTH